ncbi:MAG: Rrf2 family transcriptional regulator [Caulobacter sp.]|nr:Rrf2 family transcriptional regulator [Caulobacter sp.]
MRLTLQTDYALRSLVFLATAGEAGSTAQVISDRFRISKSHLVKVLQRLRALGYLETTRGRGGGVKLACAPETIVIGAVVRQTEDDLALVECFNKQDNSCPIIGVCGLERKLGEAFAAFLAVLDGCTVADLALTPGAWARLFPETR